MLTGHLFLLAQSGLRKSQKQQRLERDFETQVRDLKHRIDGRVEQYRQDSSVSFVHSPLDGAPLKFPFPLTPFLLGSIRAQSAFLDRLATLVQRKADIESQIIKHTRELADAYMEIKEEFEAVLRGRSEDVNEAIEVLNGMDESESLK